MERTNCVICGSDDSVVLFEDQDRLYGVPGRFPVRHCRRCQSFYLSPRPVADELAEYYPADYAPHTLATHPSSWQRWNLRYATWKLVRAVQSRVPAPGHALDVGCATGDFLAGLEQRGWQVQGVEINPQAAALAQAKIRGAIFVGDFMQSAFADCTFDLVSFWDVLEHLPEPKQALQEAARISRPSGTLILSLPNLDSLEARLFGQCWGGWDIPRHLWWCRPASLTRLLDETGWIHDETTCMRGRHWMFVLSLRLWLDEQPISDAVRRVIARVFGTLPARLLMWPYFSIIEQLKLGSIVVTIARRRQTVAT